MEELRGALSSPFVGQGANQSEPSGSSGLELGVPLEAVPPGVERNRGRGLRRAGNACEIAAGAALNSAIVFLFHLWQVHPLGFVVALGVSYGYFVATTFGEGADRWLGTAMAGCSAGLAALCSLAEPVGEWVEARESRSTATAELQALYASPAVGGGVGWMLLWAGVLVLLLVGFGRRGR